jgi:hypothetical protein
MALREPFLPDTLDQFLHTTSSIECGPIQQNFEAARRYTDPVG